MRECLKDLISVMLLRKSGILSASDRKRNTKISPLLVALVAAFTLEGFSFCGIATVDAIFHGGRLLDLLTVFVLAAVISPLRLLVATTLFYVVGRVVKLHHNSFERWWRLLGYVKVIDIIVANTLIAAFLLKFCPSEEAYSTLLIFVKVTTFLAPFIIAYKICMIAGIFRALNVNAPPRKKADKAERQKRKAERQKRKEDKLLKTERSYKFIRLGAGFLSLFMLLPLVFAWYLIAFVQKRPDIAQDTFKDIASSIVVFSEDSHSLYVNLVWVVFTYWAVNAHAQLKHIATIKRYRAELEKREE